MPPTPQNDNRYYVENKVSVASISESALQDSLHEIADALECGGEEAGLAIVEPTVFDALYSYTCDFGRMKDHCKSLLTDALTRGLSKLLPSVRLVVKKREQSRSNEDAREVAVKVTQHRNAVKMYIYLLSSVIQHAEKQIKNAQKLKVGKKANLDDSEGEDEDGSGRCKKAGGKKGAGSKKTWDWDAKKEEVLSVFQDVLVEPNVLKLWNMSQVEEDFGALFLSSAFLMFENVETVKQKHVIKALFNILLHSVKKFTLYIRATTAILHLLCNYEHLPITLASLLQHLSKDGQAIRLVTDVTFEIGRMSAKVVARDPSAARNISTFLCDVGTLLPNLGLKNVTMLLPHLDGESYMMRNGVVQMIGQLIQRAFSEGGDGSADSSTKDKSAASGDKQNKKKEAAASKKEKKNNANKGSKKKTKRGSGDSEDEDDDVSELDDSDDEEGNGNEADEEKVEEEEGKEGAADDAEEEKGADGEGDEDDAADAQRLKDQVLKSRDELLTMLLDRALDVTSFTRSKVLQTWIELVSSRTVPVAYLPRVVQMAVGRLTDKAAVVRKYAMDLLNALMQFNPFAGSLLKEPFAVELERVGVEFKKKMEVMQRLQEQREQKMQQVMMQEVKKSNAKKKEKAKSSRGGKGGKKGGKDADEEVEEGEDEIEEKADSNDADAQEEGEVHLDIVSEAQVAKAAEGDDEERLSLLNEKLKLERLKDAYVFITSLEEAIEVMATLLASKSNSDILGAIAFFVTASAFSLGNALTGVRSMMSLVWHTDKCVKDAVFEAYQELYIPEQLHKAQKSQALSNSPFVVKLAMESALKLTALVVDTTLAEMSSLEELVLQMTLGKKIPPAVVKMLWNIFSYPDNYVRATTSAAAPSSTSPSSSLSSSSSSSSSSSATKSEEAMALQSRALLLLSMMGSAEPEILVPRVKQMVSVGLSHASTSTTDSKAGVLAKTTCVALQKVVKFFAKEEEEAAEKEAKGGKRNDAMAKREREMGWTSVKEEILLRLSELLVVQASPFPASAASASSLASSAVVNVTEKANAWFGVAEQAINTVFMLHNTPETHMTTVLQAQAVKVFTQPQAGASSAASTLGNLECLSRLFFLLGHTAVRLVVMLEETEGSIKRLRALRGLKQAHASVAQKSTKAGAAKKPRAAKKVQPKGKVVQRKGGKGAKNKKKKDDEDDDDDDDEEVDEDEEEAEAEEVAEAENEDEEAADDASGKDGKAKEPAREAIEDDLAVTQSEEYELELLKATEEKKLVGTVHGAGICKPSLLAVFTPLLLKVLTNPQRFASTRLQSSAILCLCKFMCVSADVCEQHLRLLVSILSFSKDPIVRANIVIAMGDLSMRFPNSVEPWVPHMYRRLADTSLRVRKHALLVLTHLVLNDMHKAKGPLADIAVCLVDKDARVAHLASLFFYELSKKGKNPIYNCLPDVISKLSAHPDLSVDDFNVILKFLLSFVDKEKHVESLVEKLCHRFTLVNIESSQVNLGDDELAIVTQMRNLTLKRAAEKKEKADADGGQDQEAAAAAVAGDDADNKDKDENEDEDEDQEISSLKMQLQQIRDKRKADLVASEREGGAADGQGSTKAAKKAEQLNEAEMMVQQCRYVAYCLSQLNFTQGSIKKLMDNALFRCYANKLGDIDLCASFNLMVQKARKVAKQEMKEQIDQWEEAINAAHTKQLEDRVSNTKASKAKSLISKIRFSKDEEAEITREAMQTLNKEQDDIRERERMEKENIAAAAHLKKAEAAALRAAKKGKAAPAPKGLSVHNGNTGKRKGAMNSNMAATAGGKKKKKVVEESDDDENSVLEESDEEEDESEEEDDVVVKKKPATKSKAAPVPSKAAKKQPAGAVRSKRRIADSDEDDE